MDVITYLLGLKLTHVSKTGPCYLRIQFSSRQNTPRPQTVWAIGAEANTYTGQPVHIVTDHLVQFALLASNLD